MRSATALPPAAGIGHMAGEELQRRAQIKLIHAPLSRRCGRGARNRCWRNRLGDHHHRLDPTASCGRSCARAGCQQPQANSNLSRTRRLSPSEAILSSISTTGTALLPPTGTPPALIDRMQAVVAEAIKDPRSRGVSIRAGAGLDRQHAGRIQGLAGWPTPFTRRPIQEAGIKLR